MVKIYYNKDGWVCERHPYLIEKTEAVGSIEVSDEQAEATMSTKFGYAWRVVDGKLVNAPYESEQAIMHRNQEELRELESWFTDVYDMQIKQIERCKRLGIAYDNKYGTAEELDQKAIDVSARIKELRVLIEEAGE